MAGRIKVETIDGVGLLTICGSTPQNAITDAMQRELAAAVERLDADAAVRVLVLTAAGHAAFAGDDDDARDGPESAAVAALRACTTPVVARIRGDCLGLGLAIALCADVRVAAADAAFALGAARAAALGVERLLADIVGVAQARYLLLTGERIEAPEAHRIGLVTRLVADADLTDTVADLARQIGEVDADVLRATKQALSAGRDGSR